LQFRYRGSRRESAVAQLSTFATFRPGFVTTSEQLIRDIEAAFATVTRGTRATLHEAAAFEGTDYASAEERARVRAFDTETRWQDIPDSALEECADRFAFEEEGFRYHIPAYIRWHLRHPKGLGPFRGVVLFALLSVWGHKDKERLRVEQSFDRFTLEQKHVLARFVELMALEAGNPEVRYLAEQAWQSYWHKFGEPGAAPNGGPATQPCNSEVTEGPPSVS
jgi:hypothetical protein